MYRLEALIHLLVSLLVSGGFWLGFIGFDMGGAQGGGLGSAMSRFDGGIGRMVMLGMNITEGPQVG